MKLSFVCTFLLVQTVSAVAIAAPPIEATTSATMTLTSPLEHQVFQRRWRDKSEVPVAGAVHDVELTNPVLEARVIDGSRDGEWKKLSATFNQGTFEAKIDVPSGGWHRLGVRLVVEGSVIASQVVEHVGVGEIFVVAGQSNSANHGSEKLSTQTGLVATFDGKKWSLSKDPQPGASGNGGSFLPPLGDELARRLNVPIGFIACGIGATSVREWLPKGSRFPHPPTIERRVTKLPNGEWESNGEAYENFVRRIKQVGKHGFRAVLWHQGESDANQKDPTRTLPGNLYREFLVKVIDESRREIEWNAPWFVAQVSYHVPGDEASPDIREAQASLWRDGVALEGPDSDALKGDLRENDGKGVHFSGPGLRTHATRWADKLEPWVTKINATAN